MSVPSDPLADHPRPAWLRVLVPSGAAGFVWPGVCLFLLAGLVSVTLLWMRTPPADQKAAAEKQAGPEFRGRGQDKAPSEPLPEPLPEPTPVAPTLELAAADDSLREAAYERALAVYRPLRDAAPSPLREGIQLRIGLCLEGIGRWDQALVEYRKLASSTQAPHSAALAQLGQARVYLRLRQPAEARALLYDLLLRSNQAGLREQPFLGDVSYLLGLALALQTSRPPPPSPLHDSVVAHSGTDAPVERAFGFVLTREAPREEQPAAAHVLVERAGLVPEAFPVRASVYGMKPLEFLERLAEQSGTGLEVSEKARRRLEDRTFTVDVHNLALGSVLRALAEPLGLTPGRRDVLLTLHTEEELGEERLAAYRMATAREVLRDAFLTYPDDPLRPPQQPAPHPLRPAAYLEAGNLETANGNLKEALSLYQRLVADHHRSPVATEGYYNLGLIQRRLKNQQAARAAFYNVVDHNPAHELAALAYLRLGRLHLEMTEPASAVTPLRRALARSAGGVTEPAAAVTLASALLLTQKPHEAAAVIWDHRHVLDEEPYRRTASFLGAYARYRASADPARARREASDLLAALLILDDPSPTVPVGELLMGYAYRDLGMTDRLAEVYEKALPRLAGALGAEMAYAVAQFRLAESDSTRARQWLIPLGLGQYGLWTARARLRLAELALDRKQPAECLEWCWRQLHDRDVKDHTETLRLMGRAYDQLGEFRQAARCYAGVLPLP